jgi:two-component system sensor histidine kinase YesM
LTLAIKHMKSKQHLKKLYNSKAFVPLVITFELIFVALAVYILIRDISSVFSWLLVIFPLLQLMLVRRFIRDYWRGINYSERLLRSQNKNQPFEDASYSGQVIRELYDSVMRDTNAETLIANAKLFALQNQINPHFLYNTFETIRSIALDEDRHDIAEMTEALAGLFRYNISRPGEMATLAEEIENSKNYLLIQQYRFPGKFAIEWVTPVGEAIMSLTLPVLTIQPILENAIHHGIEPVMGTGKIIVRIWTTEEKLVIAVEDNGAGIDGQKLEMLRAKLNQSFFDESKRNITKNKHGSSGIALANVHQRIQLYFGEDYGLEIYSTKDVGTSVHIIIPKYYREM